MKNSHVHQPQPYRTHHDIVLALPAFEMHLWYSRNTSKRAAQHIVLDEPQQHAVFAKQDVKTCIPVYRPLIRWTIAAPFTAAMLKLERYLCCTAVVRDDTAQVVSWSRP